MKSWYDKIGIINDVESPFRTRIVIIRMALKNALECLLGCPSRPPTMLIWALKTFRSLSQIGIQEEGSWRNSKTY